MPNLKQTITTTSTALNVSGPIRAINLTNMGVNPITVKVGEAGSASFGEGVVLPSQYSSWSYESDTLFLGACAAISSGGSSDLAIFYI